jgi:beta-glucosidase
MGWGAVLSWKAVRLGVMRVCLGLALVAAFGSTAPIGALAQAPPDRIAQWPAPEHARPIDPDLESRVAAIVSQMTLEQKIGQMTQPDIRSITPEEVRQY